MTSEIVVIASYCRLVRADPISMKPLSARIPGDSRDPLIRRPIAGWVGPGCRRECALQRRIPEYLGLAGLPSADRCGAARSRFGQPGSPAPL